MRLVVSFGIAFLFVLMLVPGLSADEGPTKGGSALAEKALDALKLRLEARIEEGKLLGKSGRVEEALEAYRSIAKLYERGMEQIRQLLTLAPAAAPSIRPPTGIEPAEKRPAASQPVIRPTTASEAVKRALAWLAAHQAPSGAWQAAGFADWCNGKPILGEKLSPDGRGKALYDPGVTGLALLAFLGAGHTSQGQSPYAGAVKRGLRYLKTIQDEEGCFGPRSSQQFIYNHAAASLAMIEAYGMTRSPILQASAQRALDFIAAARNPYLGWRYGMRPGDNDTSVTTWMAMCIKSALSVNESDERAGREPALRVDPGAMKGALSWIEKVTDPDYGNVGYVQRGTGSARPRALIDRFPSQKTEAMTAAGILVRILAGQDPKKTPLIQKGAAVIDKLPPVWNPTDGSIDMYYWYYGTLAMFQVGGTHWRNWSSALNRAVVKNQRLDGGVCSYRGSWDPIGPWGMDGGRVFSTALLCLCCETQARYARVVGTK